MRAAVAAVAAADVQAGDGVSNATLFLSNVTLLWNITPDTPDGKGTPGVEFSKATYQLVGDVVATANLADMANWESVKPEEVRARGLAAAVERQAQVINEGEKLRSCHP